MRRGAIENKFDDLIFNLEFVIGASQIPMIAEQNWIFSPRSSAKDASEKRRDYEKESIGSSIGYDNGNDGSDGLRRG